MTKCDRYLRDEKFTNRLSAARRTLFREVTFRPPDAFQANSMQIDHPLQFRKKGPWLSFRGGHDGRGHEGQPDPRDLFALRRKIAQIRSVSEIDRQQAKNLYGCVQDFV
jgi:hypothetical protein